MKPPSLLPLGKMMDTPIPAKTHATVASSLRRQVRVLVLPDDCALDEPYAGWIVDRSRDSLRLLLDRVKIDIGSVLRLRHPGAPAASSWMRVRVTHHQRRGQQWILGCELVRASARCAS